MTTSATIKTRIARSVKSLVVGSPFEDLARRAYEWSTEPTSAIEKNLAYDEQTAEVMKRCLKPDSNCVDVGCHEGVIIRHMLAIAPLGSHCAFEPIPSLYRKLVAEFPTVQVFDCALSDTRGRTTFQHVISDPGYSGIKRRQYQTESPEVEEITVAKETLDSVVIHGPVHFMKIDVEGGELQVLKGAVGIIQRYQPTVIFEHGLGAADRYGTKPEQVFDLLTGCGLSVFVMKDWLRGRRPLRRKEFMGQFETSRNFYFMATPGDSLI